MKGVQEIRQLDDTHMHWVAEIAGKREEWDAEITEQVPDQRIAWGSVAGTGNAGEVQFRPLGASETEVRVRMEYEPESVIEKIGALHAPDRRVQGDLNGSRSSSSLAGKNPAPGVAKCAAAARGQDRTEAHIELVRRPPVPCGGR